jgi:type IV pilus assembly protein PilC
MDFSYVGYTEDRKIVTGTISAATEEMAGQILSHSVYQVLSLKPATTFMPSVKKAFPSLFRIRPGAIIMFSRQLALLLESGIDIVAALELLQAQASSRNLRRVLGEVVSDLRSGVRLSVALGKHPKTFPKIYIQSLTVGEQGGGLETVLRQTADYMEKEATATKGIKNALRYPIVVSIVAFIVIAIIVTFVLPAFMNLYSSLQAEPPLITRLLLSAVDALTSHGLYIILALLVIAGFLLVYIKTPEGRLQWDKLALRLPLSGKISHLNELARCCRSMSLLVRSGLSLPEIMSLVTENSNNRVMKKALTDVRQDMLKGEGLSQPMAKSQLFLPLMVQMVKVGEETGNLDVTLLSVAQNYETEAEDRMKSLVGLIQPTMTLIIGVIVGLVALSLMSAMYSMYGQMG